jgi:hypothetical protein
VTTLLSPRAALTQEDIRGLASGVAGPVLLPHEDGFDAEHAGFELTVPHHPAVVIGATGARDVLAAIRFAADRGLPVAVQATGHGASSPADGAVFINSSRMNEVAIDPVARTATIAAGARWEPVINAAAEYGLAPLSGAAPFLGAVSYTLGGGLGLLSRKYGYACDHVRGFDLVTSDGELLTVTADSEPDLFWGARGSKGNLGVVTSLTVDLFPLERVHGGSLFVDGTQLEPALQAWLAWSQTIPAEVSTSVFMMQFPDDETLPEPIRGRYVLQIRLAYAGPQPDDGKKWFGPLRAALPAPITDTVATIPYTQAGTIHNDPPDPVPSYSKTALLRSPEGGIAHVLAELAGPDAQPVFGVELRLLGGALARTAAVPAALAHPLDARLSVYISSLLPDPTQRDAIDAAQQHMVAALEPWTVTGSVLNFMSGANTGAHMTKSAYAPQDYARLQRLKSTWDPRNMFRFNPNIPPTAE